MDDLLDIKERQGFGVATVMARKGVTSEQIGAMLNVPMPKGPTISGSPELSIIGTGPGVWLVYSAAANPTFANDLAKCLSGLASVSDQSGAYTVLTLSGGIARDVLQCGAFIDLHPDSFGPGRVATTVIAHMGAILWQTDLNRFEIAFFRSFLTSFRAWIEQTVSGIAFPVR